MCCRRSSTCGLETPHENTLLSQGLAALMSALLLIGNLAFGVRLGHPLRLALALSSTALCFVGIMMLIASVGRTEEAAGTSASAILLILMMLGGAMIPRFIMPSWQLRMSNISPVKWGLQAIEGAIWRDFTLAEMLPTCAVLLVTGAGCFAAGVATLRRTEV